MARGVYLDNTIEFLKGRVYLGAYDFTPEDTEDIVFFTVEDTIFYNSFHLDFGPLNIGQLYRFAIIFHEILNHPDNADKAVVFYSSAPSRQRANAACMLCCYMILVQSWTPHQILQPLAQVDPPFMPFRDAGYSNADFEISIQDVAYGVWRAKEKGLIDLHSFNLEVYEKYEHVENGDLNILTPDFIAFASPQEDMRVANINLKSKSHLNQPFRSVLKFFSENDVQLVVRLNSHLYNKRHFEDIGIKHIDLIFEDGTCPDVSIVKNFIGAAETIIRRGGKIAVHCKAGLGRTGCLIGAHLIYTYGFTANECIGFLRFIRPGMVVGPQQHWLYLHQNDFREWRYTHKISLFPSELIGGLYPLISLEEYKAQKKKLKDSKRESLLEANLRDLNVTPEKALSSRIAAGAVTSAANGNPDDGFESKGVPQNSPGQPRKRYNGTKTTENIDEPPKHTSSPERRRTREMKFVVDNNSDSENYPEDENLNISKSGKLSRSQKTVSMAEESIDDDTLLKQLLPKNRRVTSGRRMVSSSGGIRKVSSTMKK